MALWGLGLFFGFTLLKMASWISALTVTAKLLINRYFNYKDEKAKSKKIEFEMSEAAVVWRSIDREVISGSKPTIESLFEELKGLSTNLGAYVHKSDLNKAIRIIREYKEGQPKTK